MPRARIHSLDLLRGLIMLLMAVDHVREGQWGPGRNITDPMDLANTETLVYFWRILAHFCAPGFTLLMGMSAYISRAQSHHLFKRGLVLLLVEFSLVNWAWTFNPLWPRLYWQVIAALGCALLALALAVQLPRRIIAILGLAIVLGHNLLDSLHFAPGSSVHFFWSLLHDRNILPLFGGFEMRTSYPILPNIGLAFCGYALGPWLEKEHAPWRTLGALLLAGFVLLRATNFYGDPHPWDGTVLSFFNVTKYPHSLQFLLMTMGPFLFLLGTAWQWRQPLLEQLGRVPMFFYLAHLYLIHLLALAWGALTGGPLDFAKNFGGVPPQVVLPAWSFGPVAFGLCLLLYPLCRWYEPRRWRYL